MPLPKVGEGHCGVLWSLVRVLLSDLLARQLESRIFKQE